MTRLAPLSQPSSRRVLKLNSDTQRSQPISDELFSLLRMLLNLDKRLTPHQLNFVTHHNSRAVNAPLRGANLSWILRPAAPLQNSFQRLSCCQPPRRERAAKRCFSFTIHKAYLRARFGCRQANSGSRLGVELNSTQLRHCESSTLSTRRARREAALNLLTRFLQNNFGRRQANPAPSTLDQHSFAMSSTISASHKRRPVAHTPNAMYRCPASGTHARFCFSGSSRRQANTAPDDSISKSPSNFKSLGSPLPPRRQLSTAYFDVPRAGRILGNCSSDVQIRTCSEFFSRRSSRRQANPRPQVLSGPFFYGFGPPAGKCAPQGSKRRVSGVCLSRLGSNAASGALRCYVFSVLTKDDLGDALKGVAHIEYCIYRVPASASDARRLSRVPTVPGTLFFKIRFFAFPRATPIQSSEWSRYFEPVIFSFQCTPNVDYDIYLRPASKNLPPR
ncbi:hypothetical protein R3P38DRAFT_2795569 [Favolaschia claudopus]|uniref:Uncharacterized protein n=1 Tax=Favolaschia claudopus TaxID=2862362 RepID=A0AAW0A732_9AGAR